MTDREVDPGQAAVELLAEEHLGVGRRRRELLEQVVEQVVDLLLVGGGGRLGHGHGAETVPPIAGRPGVIRRSAPGSVEDGAEPHALRRPRRCSSGMLARIRATSARCTASCAPLVAGPQVGQHAHDDQPWGGRLEVALVPRQPPAGHRVEAAPRAARGRARSPVNGSTKASASSASRTRKCIGMPMPTTRDAGPPADLDHHRGQQDRQPAGGAQHDVEERVARVVVVARRRRRSRARRNR